MTGTSAALPRSLNVQKFAESRASELKNLQSIVANRLNNDFRSTRSKRRRTTGYENKGAKNRFRKRQRLGRTNEIDDETNGVEKTVPRRIRRRIELKKNPEIGFSTSGDGTKRLRTHVWHAKRFKMTKLWGYHLPLHLQGRGRGSRAVLKKLKNGVVVHDASYYGVAQLEGPEDQLLLVLENLLVPPPSSYFESTFSKIVSGDMYGSAMLHHGGSAFSPVVAPVTYMWRPLQTEFDTKEQKTNGNDEQHVVQTSAPSRQLWVWMHPAAFREGYDTLKSACEKQTDVTGQSIDCISLEDQLAKIELMGSKAFELLQKIIHPVNCFPASSGYLHKFFAAGVDSETHHDSTPVLQNEDDICISSVISLTAKDPRTLTKDKFNVVDKTNSLCMLGSKEGEIKRQTRMSNSDGRLTSSSFFNPEENGHVHEFFNLWDASKGACPPVDENILCLEKHRQRLEFCRVTDKKSGKTDATLKGQHSKFCPALLLKNNSQRGSTERWSIILPLSWVKAFWVPLITNGGHAIGLSEKHWIACETGLPYFPSDFPDSNAYSAFMTMKATSSGQDADLLPSRMRPLKVPHPPPWDSIQLAFDKIIATDAPVHPEVNSMEVNEDSMKHFDTKVCTDNNGLGGAFVGFVARTSYTLNYLLKQINGSQLLLFPRLAGQKICISKCLNDGKGLNKDIGYGNPSVFSCEKLCFVRVLVHAYKEGVFEEGAVVCAPRAEDILSLRSNEEDGGVQLSESSLRSYFVQQPCGEWMLQVPDDPVVGEAYRWPVGFVTTGFVRGSKKPVAVAVCQAVLLARLREKQQKTIPARRRKKEIYVLVRNLRSTAYRLALASILLEAREQDVEYM